MAHIVVCPAKCQKPRRTDPETCVVIHATAPSEGAGDDRRVSSEPSILERLGHQVLIAQVEEGVRLAARTGSIQSLVERGHDQARFIIAVYRSDVGASLLGIRVQDVIEDVLVIA